MTGEIRPLHVVPNVERHGVTRYARDLAEACGCAVADDAPPEPGRPLHLHFTERLWGAGPQSAAARVSELARRHPVSVTLHDLPQPSDGAASQQRRAAAYRRVVAAARAVTCNSRWEAQLLAAFITPPRAPKIIPLAVPAGPEFPPGVVASAPEPAIGLLGFVYPGKGHAEAIDAAGVCSASLGRRVDVIALGAVSDGHEADADELRARAQRRGIAFSVTGYLSDEDLMRRARQVGVPLAAHRHVSASASIGSWLAAGRRPLVIDSPYAREIEMLRPGTIRRYEPSDLGAAVQRTLADPAASWLPPDADLRPGPRETATAYLRWWAQEVQW